MLITWSGFTSVGGMNTDLVDALPVSLKVIGLPHVGYDHFDWEAIKKRGVIMCNSPGMSDNDVADIGLHLILSTYRSTSLFESTLRSQKNAALARRVVLNFDQDTGRADPGNEPMDPMKYVHGHRVGERVVTSPAGQRVGIAGFGGIGRALAKRLHVLGMTIHYFKRSQLSQKELKSLEGIPLVRHESFESLAKESDVLVLALPLSSSTRHIVNDKTIGILPAEARVINVGRGPLVDQAALLRGLKSGKLSGAGLDVFEHEPIIEEELLSRYDVTLLPHIGACTQKAVERALINSLENIKNVVVDGGHGIHPI
ncbi:glyoxylate reductase [Sugiyamaella lignohabitans]|uniref:Glyoxylate reductase n=1 Tax=Sugiyamaella lignohabitans TaxID=796027 RepID=A0A167CLS2_9ASCO|nr:glyoxylate reductase [Sugiyamaella lignohabitans]ANB11865.1 glyoxylate reductase [Sugiyamaella lignohabitans]